MVTVVVKKGLLPLYRRAVGFALHASQQLRLNRLPLRLIAVLLTLIAILVIHLLPDSTRKLHFNPNNEYSLFFSPNHPEVSASWLDDYSHSRFKCDLSADINTWCGFSIQWPGEPSALIDFSGYHSLRLNVKYVGPAKRIRIYLRTFHEAFGDLQNPDKNKFQSTVLDISEFDNPVTIGLSDFIVADWWIQRYQIDRQYTQQDFSQVVSLAIDFPQPGSAGEHVMHAQSITLVGEYFAKETAYLALLIAWMAALLFEGGYRYYRMSSRFRHVQAKALSLASYANELRLESSMYKKLSGIDPLTQVFNRSGAKPVIAKHFSHSSESASGVLLVIDIDHFKSINDGYGHNVGDEVIRRVAACLKANVAASDIIVRWGGEEFLVLCPSCDYVEGRKIAERLRVAIESLKAALKPDALGVTVSVGATVIRRQDDFNRAFERADKHLYCAKHAGRNRVVYDPMPEGLISSIKKDELCHS